LAFLKVIKLVYALEVVSLEVKHCEMLDETNIEQIIYLVIADVKLFQLLEGLDALHVFELASS
jgi:hypothetical protein